MEDRYTNERGCLDTLREAWRQDGLDAAFARPATKEEVCPTYRFSISWPDEPTRPHTLASALVCNLGDNGFRLTASEVGGWNGSLERGCTITVQGHSAAILVLKTLALTEPALRMVHCERYRGGLDVRYLDLETWR